MRHDQVVTTGVTSKVLASPLDVSLCTYFRYCYAPWTSKQMNALSQIQVAYLNNSIGQLFGFGQRLFSLLFTVYVLLYLPSTKWGRYFGFSPRPPPRPRLLPPPLPPLFLVNTITQEPLILSHPNYYRACRPHRTSFDQILE